MPVLTEKSIWDDPAQDDGLRLLVTRYWPRGVARDKVDLYLPDLAPSKTLLHEILEDRISWREFATAYKSEMKPQRSAIRLLAHLDQGGRRLSLLCTCHEETRCHRSLLAGLVEKAG